MRRRFADPDMKQLVREGRVIVAWVASSPSEGVVFCEFTAIALMYFRPWRSTVLLMTLVAQDLDLFPKPELFCKKQEKVTRCAFVCSGGGWGWRSVLRPLAGSAVLSGGSVQILERSKKQPYCKTLAEVV